MYLRDKLRPTDYVKHSYSIPVDHSVSTLANLIRHDLRSLATHTHTPSLLPRIHTQQNRAHHPLLPEHNPYNPPPSLRCDSQLSPIDILSAPSLPSFLSLPPSNRLTILFSSSLQHKTPPHHTRAEHKPDPRADVRRKTPPSLNFRARTQETQVLRAFLSRISDSIDLVSDRTGA